MKKLISEMQNKSKMTDDTAMDAVDRWINSSLHDIVYQIGKKYYSVGVTKNISPNKISSELLFRGAHPKTVTFYLEGKHKAGKIEYTATLFSLKGDKKVYSIGMNESVDKLPGMIMRDFEKLLVPDYIMSK